MGGRPPRALAWAAVGALAVVMMLGNIVSATGSGLGCPDWPLCHGRFIPPGGTEIWIEFRHRLAVPVFSLLLLATAVVTIHRRPSPRLRRVAIALIALLAAQILLGGVTVLLGLSTLVSTIHLLVALSILAGLVTICAAEPAPRPARAPARLARLAAAGLAALLVQLALGGYVRHAGAGLACPAFPLCDGGGFLPAHWLAVVHWTHRWLGVALLGLFTQLALAARGSAAGRPAGIALALAVAQLTLGILTVLLQLTPSIRATHAAGGYALWATLVWTALRAGVWRPRDGVASRTARPMAEGARAS
jgi:heme A synthase